MWPSRLRRSAQFAWNLRGQARFPFLPPACDPARAAAAAALDGALTPPARCPITVRPSPGSDCKPVDFRSGRRPRTPAAAGARRHRARPRRSFRSTAPRPEDLLRVPQRRQHRGWRAPSSTTRGACSGNAAHGERERCILHGDHRALDYGYRELVIGLAHCTVFKVQQYCRDRAFYPRGVGIERPLCVRCSTLPDAMVRLHQRLQAQRHPQ